MKIEAYVSSPTIGPKPVNQYANKYIVIAGEWPPGLTIDNGGNIHGIVSENRVTSPGKMGNPPLVTPYDQSNYLEYAYPGLNAEFTVQAYRNNVSFGQQNFSLYIKTNWSSRRDDFILNIKNEYPTEGLPEGLTYPVGEGYTFLIDGASADNETYLKTMKSRGYFPGPDVCQ